MTVNEILQYLNTIAPFSFAAADDNIGLLVGNGRTEVSGICCALDITNEVIGGQKRSQSYYLPSPRNF